MPSDHFPRVLLVADSAVGDTSGTGITLANIYRQWPTDSLAQVCGRPLSDRRDFPSIPTLQVDKSALLGYGAARKLRVALRRSQDANTSAGTASAALPPPVVRSPTVGAWLDLIPLRVRAGIRDLINDFEPEVIVTTSGSVRITAMAILASARASVPIVPHLMDDWISTSNVGSAATRIPRMVLDRELRRMWRNSPRGLAISQAMATEYATRFGVPFLPIGNLVQVAPQEAPSLKSGPMTLGYLGGMHLGRDEQLRRLAVELEDRPGCSLRIYAPGNAERRQEARWAALRNTQLMDPVAADEVIATASQFDVLVHVESFEPSQRAYTRLSISTKIPQYLSVGRPILAIGPEEVASIRYVEDNGVGLAVGSEGGLEDAIARLGDEPARAAWGSAATACALRDFEVTSGTERMRAWLAEAVS